jgi:hypothetical protein
MKLVLSELCNKLSPLEKEILGIILIRERSRDSLIYKLYDLIINQGLNDDSLICNILYGSPKIVSKYSHLKADLLYDVYRVKCVGIKKRGFRIEGKLSKRLIVQTTLLSAQFYYYSNDLETSFNILESLKRQLDIRNESDEYEYYMNVFFNLFSNKISAYEQDKLMESMIEIPMTKYNKSQLIKKLKILLRLLQDNRVYELPDREYELENVDKYNGYDKIFAIRYNIAVHYFNADFEYIMPLLDSLLESINEHSDIKSDLGGLELIRAKFWLVSEKYNNALDCYLRARSFFVKNSANDAQALIGVCISHLYMHDSNKFKSNVCLFEEFPMLSNFDLDFVELLKVVNQFVAGNTEVVLQSLQKETSLFSYRNTWRIFIKLLEIYCLLDLRKFDIVGVKLDAFRKLLDSLKDKISVRYFIICKMLIYINRNIYSKTLLLEIEKGMQKLGNLDGHDRWNPAAFELVSFETWIFWRYGIDSSDFKRKPSIV